jgi:hypothetical protein
MDRYAADRTVKRLARRAGINKRIWRHCLRHSFITAARTPACHSVTCKKPDPYIAGTVWVGCVEVAAEIERLLQAWVSRGDVSKCNPMKAAA